VREKGFKKKPYIEIGLDALEMCFWKPFINELQMPDRRYLQEYNW
jgi:hypothetical protein